MCISFLNLLRPLRGGKQATSNTYWCDGQEATCDKCVEVEPITPVLCGLPQQFYLLRYINLVNKSQVFFFSFWVLS